MSFTESFIQVDGCKVRLRRGGAGKPLLFLHGASGAPVIQPFMEKLATRFDVLVPEHPGYGQSDEPAWLENIHDMAYFYLDFLKQLELRDVVLVGGSMGGWMAMEIAVRDTSRLACVILVGPAGVKSPEAKAADLFLWSNEDLVRNLFHDQKLAEQRLAMPVTPEAVDIDLKNKHTTAKLAWEPRFHDPFLPKWLHRIDVPVKIIWGAEDRILPPAMAQELKRRMPHAELELVPNAGHLPQSERPDAFCESVISFACK